MADALGMVAVVVPPRAGVLSAAGCLAAPVSRELVRSWPSPSSNDGLPAALAALAEEARAAVGGVAGNIDIVVETALDCRYAGQSHELTVATVDDFDAEHVRRNGHLRPGAPVEVVALRARASLPSPVSVVDLPPVPGGRPTGVGPCVLAEPDCTIWVPDGWEAVEGRAGALVIRRRA
jgi:N-methylhydantoinase A/oxoprolinase/acetone carboxylase beta subunit